MNIHEYQGKSILKSFGVAIQNGRVAETPELAHEAAVALAEETGTSWFVVKAQIHAGGRGKGSVTETGSHGVVIAKGLDQVKEKAAGILGGHLVTAQTSADGKQVSKVLIAEDVYGPGDSEPSEIYMSVLLDRANGQNIIMYSPQGGMDIEAVAEETPELIFREAIDPTLGLQGFQARRIAFNLGLSGKAFKEMTKFVNALYNAYVGSDATMFEINPVLKTSDDRVIAVDAKVSLDGNALYRHKDYAAMRDVTEEDATEVEADAAGLNYVKLDGNVGCMVNGAGLAMATMDIIKLKGAEPANFLDVGGGATKEKVTEAFKIITSDPNVKGILVNIFGGIMRCDVIAEGVIAAVTEVGLKVPLVVRLEGTNVDRGKEIINTSGLDVIAADNLSDAAEKIVKAVKG